MENTNYSSRSAFNVDVVNGWINKAIEFINDTELAEKYYMQLAHVEEKSAIWAAFDLLNRIDIAYLRQLSTELTEKADACKATWPTQRFEATFVTPREERRMGWLNYVSLQISVQVAEYAKEDVEVEADSRENAVYLSPDKRQALGHAIENAEKILAILDPEMGAHYFQLDKLAELSGIISARADACKLAWPPARFEEVFVTPKPGHDKGWLEFVVGSITYLATRRNIDPSRYERVVENAEKLLAVLRPEAPYWCRKCGQPLANGKFSFCETCHKQWLDAQGQREDEIVVPAEGLHRKVNKAGSASKRHTAANGYKPKSKRAENEAAFEASKKDGARKREQRQQRSRHSGDGE